ncbi:MAG: hypothetical protein PUH03_03440 [bacterium]|nr:hypothetical protein [bacterium]MDY2830464.1 hypothetical protein [Alphaproteobacteria bacterium]
MKKFLISVLVMLGLGACSIAQEQPEYVEPDFNAIVDNVRVVDKTSNYVIYEYSNVRIDGIAPVAAIYCHDQGKKTAHLYEIVMQPNHKRRATFACR